MIIKCFEYSRSSELELKVQSFFNQNKDKINILSTNQSLNNHNIVFTIIYEYK